MPQRIVRVLIDSPLPQLDRLFDYTVPDALESSVQPGVRLRVPLRTVGRIVDAIAIEVVAEASVDRPLSEIDSVVSTACVVPPFLYTLARKVADRAGGAANDILRLAVPKRQVRVEKQWLTATEPVAAVVAGDAVSYADTLVDDFPGLAAAVIARERVALTAIAHPVTTNDGGTVGAWAMLVAALATQRLASGESTIVVVPDYRDQDAVMTALSDFVADDAVARVDARQSGPDRYRSFLRTLAAAPVIVVGNRSAIYSPVDASLIVMWDDGDSLLEEPLAPYVHSRDAALVRQELSGCALVFAGHTRTSDVERLIALGYVTEITAARRYAPSTVLTASTDSEAPGTRIPSSAYRAVREALATGPVLVQVSRPGYAPVLVCAKCRTPSKCAHCSGPLHAKARGAAPQCRWCGRTAHSWKCPDCQSVNVRLASSGSERTADDLGRAFPGARVVVSDGEHTVMEVGEKPALVVATRGAEPIAAGGYHAVLLLDGDRMLMSDDLRVAESCLRWWSNAAALAAPGAPVHLVGVTGDIARTFATWTHAAFAQSELAERAPLRMPPTSRVAMLEGDHESLSTALAKLRDDVPQLARDAVLGPLPLDGNGDELARTLVRYDYALGHAVVTSLRASVIAAAVAGRRSTRTRPNRPPRATLKLRTDVADPQL
ncbi:primosomal protein N' [Microbacterium sp. YY-03]|uniref:primosomal protein N' family DNA-binding protein n=1 Tax=Microbacterium sp. YY-03 TaxID=3421636 RepID=UPI003D18404B